ncbi:hypothetical protein HDU97_009605, partial [Phlyctochytrium planicorne]
MPDVDFDFWKFFRSPKALSVFPRPGSAPHILLDGGIPLCDGDPFVCVNNTYVPKWFKQENADSFVEILHVTPDYSYSFYQRLIDGLQLNATIKFLGDSFDAYVQEQFRLKKPFLAYNWKPTAFVSTTPVEFDIPADKVFKVSSMNFANDFMNLQSLLQKFQLGETDVDFLLKELAVPGMSVSEVSCKWLKQNIAVWKNWMPPPPNLHVTCNIGEGKYNVNGFGLCLSCPAGTYNWMNGTSEPCMRCPDHAFCPGGDKVNVASGYWQPEKSLSGIPNIYKCPNTKACCP